MDNVLATFNESQIAVDLGCGAGSFNYLAYRCRIIGIDVTLDVSALRHSGDRIQYVRSTSNYIPLAGESADAVICNHTLEHFENYEQTLTEIGRILKPDGFLWISAPNGFGLDDALYRGLFAGGGHVNRFRFESLVNAVQEATGLSLLQHNFLYSGFVYLTKRNHPYAVLMLNAGTRMVDRLLGTRLGLYGWGFIFGRSLKDVTPLPSFFNVCCNCGAGDGLALLETSGKIRRRFGFRFYSCPHCQHSNILFTPPAGFC